MERPIRSDAGNEEMAMPAAPEDAPLVLRSLGVFFFFSRLSHVSVWHGSGYPKQLRVMAIHEAQSNR